MSGFIRHETYLKPSLNSQVLKGMKVCLRKGGVKILKPMKLIY